MHVRKGGTAHPAPEALVLALACQRWGCLPHSGGYLAQGVRRMKSMETALGWYEGFTTYQRLVTGDAEVFGKWLSENGKVAERWTRFVKEELDA